MCIPRGERQWFARGARNLPAAPARAPADISTPHPAKMSTLDALKASGTLVVADSGEINKVRPPGA